MEIALALSPVITYAGAQNFMSPIQQLSVTNQRDVALTDVRVQISADPSFAAPLTLHIEHIAAGQTYALNDVVWRLSHTMLSQQTESVRATVCVEVWCQDQCLAQHSQSIDVLAYHDWSGFRQLPELLIAFVQPNHPVVAELQRSASSKLLTQFSQSLCGYQTHSREAVMRQIGAVYAAIADWDIHYSNPPASFTGNGQKIRLPDHIQQERMATCLDSTLLFAACLEQAGLNPLVFLEQGHAWVGCWLVDQGLPSSSTDDQANIRKRIAAGELLAIESTGLTPQSRLSFAHAVRVGAEHFSASRQLQFELAIDVKQARQGLKILPISLRHQTASSTDLDLEIHETPIDDVVLPPLSTDVWTHSTHDSVHERSRVDVWRAKLLDLTLRNKLINFKTTSKQAIPLFSHQPDDIENRLAQGKTLKLKSLIDLLPEQDPRSLTQQARATQAHLSEHLSAQALSNQELLANLTGDDLDKRLTDIFRQARTAQEEGGANTLFLVFGMLQWSDSKESSRSMLAPIVMVPVTLERQSVNSTFSLKRHDDDTVVNPTLLQLLEHQFDLHIPRISQTSELPQDEFGVDIAAIWASFRSAVVDLTGFEVIPSVWLGVFSFTKYLMWKDLTDRLADILQSPLVRHLMQKDEQPEQTLAQGEFIEEARLDEKCQPQDLFVPADCDSSQLAAVNAAAHGLSFVLEGPPGTGKSQTITNIIADALARDKTVLFVSEKIAALNVVHERLKKLGLAPFLLELHSSKATKSEVLAQFERALKSGSQHRVAEWNQEAQRLQRLRQGLNDYVDALHRRHGNGLTVFAATSRLIHSKAYPACPFAWPSPDLHNAEQLDQLRDLSKQMAAIGDLVPAINREHLHTLGITDWSRHAQHQLEQQCELMQQTIAAFEQACSTLETALHTSDLTEASLAQCDQFDALCGVLLAYQPDYLPLCNTSDVTQQQQWITTTQAAMQTLQQLESTLYQDWLPEICQQPIAEIRQAWRQTNGDWWLKKWFAQFRLRNLLRMCHVEGLRPHADHIMPLLDLVSRTQHAQQQVAVQTQQAAAQIGTLWAGQHTPWPLLSQAHTWRTTFEQHLQAWLGHQPSQHQHLHTELIQQLQQQPQLLTAQQPLGQAIRTWQHAYHEYRNQYQQLRNLAGLTTNLPMQTTHLLAQIRHQLRGWQASLPYLRDWCHWQQLKRDAHRLGLQPLVALLESGQVAWSDAADCFDDRYADWWLGQIFSQTPALSRFVATDHERKIQEFRSADDRFAELTKQYIYAKLAAKIPASEFAPAQTPLGILKREIQKKSRHMPVRKLLSTTADLLSHLAPCMLMSPLSVAQYLDAANTRFDLVIFDEASQIPTWDAIGAMARGQQVIVVGDPKQLPPTSFFAATQSDDGSTDDIQDLESILDECLGSGMRVHTLKWHYRSQKESLITFSNHRYYQSQLLTFPSPIHPDHGVTFHAVDGVYQRAGARHNRQEADAVVAFIQQHLAQPYPPSIGVVTFSQAQQQLIEDLLDAARRQHPEFDRQIQALTHEPLFVKNLENVQGDERDVILFSICYGPDETGRVAMNFGPLNREGGHRRLNVAITRAKTQIHIFSTLHPDQLDLSRSKARGVRDLKHYLEFALRGAPALIAQTSPTGLPPDSPFETEVADFLRHQGWHVHHQVGCSSYRIDLAVVDPQAEGRYVLAVECDGASYHSAATARDRDKLRQMVLERLGWTVHRIWSTEWWCNREREQQRLLDALEHAMQSARVTLSSAPDAPPSLAQEPVTGIYYEYSKPSTTDVTLPYPITMLEPANSDDFFVPSEQQRLHQMITQVITQEAPVLDRVIIKRIVSAYGFQRTGTRILQRLNQQLDQFHAQPAYHQRVYWSAPHQAQTWRGWRELADREIDDVPLIELAQCAQWVLTQLVVAEEDTITRMMGNVLGYSRVTRSTQDKLRAGLVYLQDEHRVEHSSSGWKLV